MTASIDYDPNWQIGHTTCQRCARCGNDHGLIEVKRLKRDIDTGDALFQGWFSCPDTGEPVFVGAMSAVDSSDIRSKPSYLGTTKHGTAVLMVQF